MRKQYSWDEFQEKAITAQGKDLIVSASAGSGKTTIMIERVIRLIEQGADLKKMLIVTFTRASAADMRAKLFTALFESSENANCLAALEKLPLAQISTLHSFCGNIASKYFYAIDIDPSFTLLEEGAGEAMVNACLDELCESVSESGDELYEIYMKGRKDKRFREAVKKLFYTASAQPDPKQWLKHCLDGYDDDKKSLGVIEQWYDERLSAIKSAVEDCLLRTQQAGFTRNVAALESTVSAIEKRDKSLMTDMPRTKYDAQFIDLNEECKEVRGVAQDTLDERAAKLGAVPSRLAKPYAESLVGAVQQLMKLYGERKRKNAKADYNDLEHYAYGILRSECGEDIRNSYDYIFVDEYQDINPLQDAIIELLKRDGNLFMVGDLKQSIYAFRGCDPSIFARKREGLKTGGISVELNKNFRTLPEVVDGINRVFSVCMTKDCGGVDYGKEARLIGTRTGKGAFAYTNVETGDSEKQTVRGAVYHIREHEQAQEMTAAQAESDYVARRIVEMLTYSEGGEEIRPDDITVLTRSMGRLTSLLRDKLRAYGVPVFLKEERAADYKEETAPLIALLRLIDNGADDIMLVSVLLSYIEQVSCDELASIARDKQQDEPFYMAARRSERLKSFFERLDRYTERASAIGAAELLSEIVGETDAFIKVRSLFGEDGTRLLAGFLGEIDLNQTVSELIESLDNESSVSESAPKGCVRIMTVHMSKGLEFEHVIYIGVGKEFNKKDLRAPYFVDSRLGAALKYPNPTTHGLEHTFLSEAVHITALKRSIEEEMRIAYVAMTRARKSLEIVGCDLEIPGIKQRLKPPSHPSDFFTGISFKTVKAPLDDEDVLPPTPKRIDVSGNEELAESIRERMEYVYPFSSVAAKTTVTERARRIDEDGYYYGETVASLNEDDEPMPIKVNKPEKRADADSAQAAERGTAFHLFLKELDFFAPLHKQREKFEAEHPQESALIDFDKIERCAKLVGDTVQGYKLYTEQEFIADFDGTLVQGVIDLLAIKDGEAVIIDYKTGINVDSGKYRLQLDYYARAAESVLSLKVVGKYICALDLAELIEVK